MKIYITKYALTSGIKEAGAEIREGVAVVNRSCYPTECFFKNDWHTSQELAKARAEEMRIKKIASLNKQITKLERLKF